MLEGPGRPLNLLGKMLIVTTPGGLKAATPLERGKIFTEPQELLDPLDLYEVYLAF